MKNNDNSVLTDKKELSAMVSDLSEKEKEFDLRIKGLQQILIDENKKKNILEKEYFETINLIIITKTHYIPILYSEFPTYPSLVKSKVIEF